MMQRSESQDEDDGSDDEEMHEPVYKAAEQEVRFID